VQPSELYQLCLLAGLGGPAANYLEPSLLTQRELLLNVAIEHNMVSPAMERKFWFLAKVSRHQQSVREKYAKTF